MEKNILDITRKIDEVLNRGVGEFIDPGDIFRNKLIDKALGKYDKDIIIKYGLDPTRPDIHLGHAVCFFKLRELQDLGCKIIFLIGDFTASIGDPTGKSKARLELEQQEIEKNIKTYLDQVGSILDLNEDKFDWIRNSDWILAPADLQLQGNVEIGDSKTGHQLSFPPTSIIAKAAVWEDSRMQKSRLHKSEIHSISVIKLLSALRSVTHSRLVERDMFQERIKKQEPLFMHEMLYPIFQGLDSNVLSKIYGSCDLEVGGTDQTFNMLMGRELMGSDINVSDQQAVLSLNLLVGIDGKEKMSKSLDNYIAITDAPEDMYKKIMDIPDEIVESYFTHFTSLPIDKVIGILSDNPREAHFELANEIVAMFHGKKEAEQAKGRYQTVSEGGVPENIRSSEAPLESTLVEFLVAEGLAISKSDARRKIEQGGVSIDGKKVTDPGLILDGDNNGKIVKVGKNNFVKISF